MRALHTIDALLENARVAEVHAPVAIEVVHAAVAVVVNEDVGGVAVHVPAQGRAAARITAGHVVARRPEVRS